MTIVNQWMSHKFGLNTKGLTPKPNTYVKSTFF